MAQFKAYKNPNTASRKTYPYLLDIQSNLLADLRTTVVIPLSSVALSADAAITGLCPILEIKGEKLVAMTQQLSGVERKHLGEEVEDLSHYRQEIVAAMDFIIAGI